MQRILGTVTAIAISTVSWTAAQAQFGGTTPASAWGASVADMIRAEGQYNQATSAAVINLEQARSVYIENQRRWADLYLTRQRILSTQRAQAVEYARQNNIRHLDEQAARPSSLPPRIVSSQFDRSTGNIEWPPALMRSEFAFQRGQIEDVLAKRAETGPISESNSELNLQIKILQELLRDHIREIMPQEYMDAKKFLESLNLEARFPVATVHTGSSATPLASAR